MIDSACRIDAAFVPGAGERLFTVRFDPHQALKGVVLFVPPFAEEMNRSRQMVSSLARLLAARGYRVVIPDLAGTGDSYGQFGASTWEGWHSDIAAVAENAKGDADMPFTLLGLRLGGLLALAAMREHALGPDHVVLWSPCLSGSAFMKQFLRLRLMSSMIGKSERKETIAGLSEHLLAGEALEVAGYEISPALYRSIAAQDLVDLMDGLTVPITWFELVADEQSTLPAAAGRAVAGLTASGCRIRAEAVAGPKFWSTAEIAVAPQLAELTVSCIDGSAGDD